MAAVKSSQASNLEFPFYYYGPNNNYLVPGLPLPWSSFLFLL